MSCFHPLHTHLKPPERLNNPFGYVPSPLCQLAAGETQRFILSQDSWQEELHQGKMFGVLVVENHEGVLGFLAAYSGLLANRNDWEWFVPPVFDAQQPDGHFKKEEAVISQINKRLNLLPQSSEWQQAQRKLEEMRQTQAAELSAYKQRMSEAKAKRDIVREAREKDPTLPSEEELTKESQKMKADLRRLKKRHAEALAAQEAIWRNMQAEADALKQERRQRSEALQRWLFSRFAVLNAKGENGICSTSLPIHQHPFPHQEPVTAAPPNCCNMPTYTICALSLLPSSGGETRLWGHCAAISPIIRPVVANVCPYSPICFKALK